MRFRSWRLGALSLILAAPVGAQTLRAAGPPVPLLRDGADAMHAVWSPDGAHLAFTRDGYEGLWVVDADGSDARQLSDAPAAGYGFAWSPDGTALAARTARYEGPRRFDALTVLTLDGTVTALTEERAELPALPQWAGTRHVALVTDGAVEVFGLDANARAVPDVEVVAARVRGGMALAETASGTVRVASPLEGARLLNVTPSPDGERVAFEVYGGDLFVMRRDGSELVDLGRGERPTWSPDGRWVAFMTTTDDGHAITGADLAAARVDGSARVALTATPDALEMNPSWSPDGRALAYDDRGALFLLPVTE